MPRKQVKRAIVLIIGWVLVVLGVIGLFLPLLQGVLLLLLGLYVLSRESRTARRLFERLRQRYPGADGKLHHLRQRLRSLWPGGRSLDL